MNDQNVLGLNTRLINGFGSLNLWANTKTGNTVQLRGGPKALTTKPARKRGRWPRLITSGTVTTSRDATMGYPQPSPSWALNARMDAVNRLNGGGLADAHSIGKLEI